jgi:hypothetical protein
MGSAPFGPLSELEAITAPTIAVGTLDEYDHDHPRELAERYAAALSARFVCEPEGKMPIAWNGGALATQGLALAEQAFVLPAPGEDDRRTFCGPVERT